MTSQELSRTVDALAGYAMEKKLIAPEDRVWAVNSLLAALGADEYIEGGEAVQGPLAELLERLATHAVKAGLCGEDITSRDLFDTRLMGLLTPRPSQIIGEFWSRYGDSPQSATDWYYAFSQDVNYIRRERRFGSFARSFDVAGIDEESISAAYQDGILELTLPKAKPAAPAVRQIQIQ